jgi:O-antigen/teichoic acid export membrane protein
MITLSSRGITLVIQIGSMMILARILTPTDYGMMAMVAAITGFAKMFSSLGLSTATIQMADINHDQVSTLFWINTGIGAILSLIVASLSPTVAWFYQTPELVWVMLALSITFFINGLAVQHSALLNRQMHFFSLAKIEIISMITGILLAILAALKGVGYWALVLGNLTQCVCSTTGVWFSLKWLPSLPKRDPQIGAIVKFGSDIMAFNIVNYFSRNLDNILIGKFHGSSVLGLYSKAYQLLMMPITNLRDPMTRVALPTLSRLQNAPERYRNYYMKFISLLAFLSMPIIGFMFVCSDQIIILALGDQWIDASILFKILAVVAFIQPVSSTRGLVLLSLGESRKNLIMGTITAIIVSVGFIMGLPWGAKGVAISYVIVVYSILIPSLIYSFSNSPIGLKDFFASIYRPLTSSLFMCLACYLLLKSINHFPFFVILPLCFAGCLVVFPLTFIAISGSSTELREHFSYLKQIFKKQ